MIVAAAVILAVTVAALAYAMFTEFREDREIDQLEQLYVANPYASCRQCGREVRYGSWYCNDGCATNWNRDQL